MINLKHYFTNGLLNIHEENNVEMQIPEEENVEVEETQPDGENPMEEPELDEMANLDEENPEETQDYSIEEQLPPNSTLNSTEQQKMKHLYNLSIKLYDYSKLVEQNIKNIDQSSIDFEAVVTLARLKTNLNLYLTKINDFITDIYVKETYEKNLYTYLALRNQLISIIKVLKISILDREMELEDSPTK